MANNFFLAATSLFHLHLTATTANTDNNRVLDAYGNLSGSYRN